MLTRAGGRVGGAARAAGFRAAVAAAAVDGTPGLRDEDLSADGRFLYAVDADGGRVFGWEVDDGQLSPLGSWNGLPATVAGIAVT